MVRKTNTKLSMKRKSKKAAHNEESIVFTCSSCAQPQLLVQGKRNILCHPKLQVGVCRECLIFSHADLTPIDEEGYEIFCTWCSELGNLVCCDGCKAPFCEECISRNIGTDYFNSLSDCDEWNCFVCNSEPIEEMRELTKAALDHQNYKEPSDLLLEKCSAVFKGDADINDSDREEIVKERLRLRRHNLNDTLKKKMKKDKNTKEEEAEEEEENTEREEGSEIDEQNEPEAKDKSDEEHYHSASESDVKTSKKDKNSKAKSKKEKDEDETDQKKNTTEIDENEGSKSDDEIEGSEEVEEEDEGETEERKHIKLSRKRKKIIEKLESGSESSLNAEDDSDSENRKRRKGRKIQSKRRKTTKEKKRRKDVEEDESELTDTSIESE